MVNVKFDMSELKAFNKQIKKGLTIAADVAEETLNTMAAEYLRVAKMNTPVGGGKEFSVTEKGFDAINAFEVKKGKSYNFAKRNNHGGRTKQLKRIIKRRTGKIDYKVLTPSEHMRRSWQAGDVTVKGNTYSIPVVNTASYASFVNDGHRQTPGRFVPAIGKRLVNNWVDGLFMAEKAENSVKRKSNRIVNRLVQKELEKVFK